MLYVYPGERVRPHVLFCFWWCAGGGGDMGGYVGSSDFFLNLFQQFVFITYVISNFDQLGTSLCGFFIEKGNDLKMIECQFLFYSKSTFQR